MSSKLTSHFRGTKSDRRSSTGKGKGKAVARIEGARVHRPSRRIRRDFSETELSLPNCPRLTYFDPSNRR